jgi:hypothetical protein
MKDPVTLDLKRYYQDCEAREAAYEAVCKSLADVITVDELMGWICDPEAVLYDIYKVWRGEDKDRKILDILKEEFDRAIEVACNE